MIINPADRLAAVGEYYFSSKLKEVAALTAQGREVINLGIGSPDLGPPTDVIQTLISEIQIKGVHGYQPYQGIVELREAIANFYNTKYQVRLNAATEVLPLMGSKEGIMHSTLAYVNPGDEVMVPELGYPTYSSVSKLASAEIIYYPLLENKHWEPDWAFMESHISKKTKLIWLNYPHMPTGARGDLDLLIRFVSFAKKHQILLCHDNPYSFIQNEHPLSIFNVVGAREVAIELNSLSKTFNMTGWRVGWLCGAKELIDPILRVKSNMDSGMFKPMQLAAVQALESGDSWFHNMNATYRGRQELVFEFLDQLNCKYAALQSGLFVWAKVPNKTGEDLCNRLLYDYDIFVTPGKVFGAKGENYIRVSLCQDEKTILRAIDRLK